MKPVTAAKRRRRTREQGADFRNALIDAARELFAADGVESVSIRKIAERAGCPTMTFYVYFASKRELLYHIWADVFRAVRAACEPALGSAAPAPERLRAVLLAMATYWIGHPEAYRLVYLNEDFTEPDDERYFGDTGDEGGRLHEVEGLLEAGVREGVFRPMDVIEVSQSLYAGVIGLAHLLITVPEYAWRRETLAATTFDLLLRGLEAVPANAISET